MNKFAIPAVKGQKFGCSDTGVPLQHTEAELSRLFDCLHAACLAGLEVNDVFRLAPDSMKVEFNYAKWRYVPAATK